MSAKINWADAMRRLEKHGSDEDPVIYDGKETTPRRLSYDHHDMEEAGSTPISYYAGPDKGWVKGTLGGMIRNRSKIPQ